MLDGIMKQKAKNNTREMLAHKWDINNKAFHTVDTEKKKTMIVMIIYQAVMISWNSQEERTSSRGESHER